MPAQFSGRNGKTTIQGVTAQPTITDVDAQTVDATYGQPEADVINSLRTKVNTVLAQLEATGLFASS